MELCLLSQCMSSWFGQEWLYNFTFRILSPHKSCGSCSTTKTFSVQWKINVFLHNWQKFMYDWHFSLLHLETGGCVASITFVKMIFLCNIMGNYYFSGDLKWLLKLFSVVLLHLFMNTFIVLHSIPSYVASVCVDLLSGISRCFCLHYQCICL